MARTITMKEAQRNFADCVTAVQDGEQYVITRDGVAVARLVPLMAGRRALTPAREAALVRTHARMDKGWPLGAVRTARDELHRR